MFKNSTPDIIDSNGQKYRIGWDDYGYFTFQMVTENPYYEEDPDAGPRWLPAEDHDGNKYPPVSFPPSETQTVIDAIERR